MRLIGFSARNVVMFMSFAESSVRLTNGGVSARG
jgi:hypothetical protein